MRRVSFNLNFLTDEVFPGNTQTVNDSDVFGLTTGDVRTGPFLLLSPVVPANGSYSGTVKPVQPADFSDGLIMESNFGVFPTIPDASQFRGQTGFRNYFFTVEPGVHTWTFFVADSHTDGVASALLIDNLRISVSAAGAAPASFGTVTMPPALSLNGVGTDVDSIAFWEAPDPAETRMYVTSKGDEWLEVWKFPFAGNELTAIQFPANINGVAVDQATGPVPGWEASPFAIGFLNADGHMFHCNEALRLLVGYTADQLALMPVARYTHPDDVPAAVSCFRRLLEGEISSYRLDIRLIGEGGGAIWIDCYVATNHQEDGALWTALVMVQDITSRKVAEVGMRNENARLSRIVEIQAEIAATQLELEAASQLIAERAKELTNSDGAMVSVLNGDETLARAVIGSTTGRGGSASRCATTGGTSAHSPSQRKLSRTRIAARSSCWRSSCPRR